jgi:hypothetical protein
MSLPAGWALPARQLLKDHHAIGQSKSAIGVERHRLDGPDAVAAENVRELERNTRCAGAQVEIEMVQCRRVDSHEDLPGRGHGIGDVLI